MTYAPLSGNGTATSLYSIFSGGGSKVTSASNLPTIDHPKPFVSSITSKTKLGVYFIERK